jgi:ankyrin repeat protein
MKFKNWLLKEEYLKTGSAIIYHRTSKESLSGIIATGFQAGRGDMYGKGFYATLDLESQNNDYMLNSYGDTLTKWFIPHLNHFVIFNTILANMVHGTSSIEEQLKKIVGENLPQLDANISNYTKIAKSSPNAYQFSKDYLNKLNPQQKEKIAGLIFSGESDGNIFVAYNNDEIIFNGFVYAPAIMNSDQINQLKTGHGWQSRVDSQRIKDVYQMPKDDKRSGIAGELNKDKESNKDNEKLNLLNDQLMNRAENGNLRAVEYLIKKGANDFNNAMVSASKNGHVDIVKLMIEKGAYNFDNSLYASVENGHLNVVELIIDKNDWSSKSVDYIMALAAGNGHLHIVKKMIDEYGANDFDYGLENAAKNGHLNIIEYLIKKGAKNFNQAMFLALKAGHIDIFQKMIDEYGANDYNKSLIVAAINGNMTVVKEMIKKGAKGFESAMDYAATNGHLEIVKLMIEKGATNFDDSIEWAFEGGHQNIVDYVQKYKRENGIK